MGLSGALANSALSATAGRFVPAQHTQSGGHTRSDSVANDSAKLLRANQSRQALDLSLAAYENYQKSIRADSVDSSQAALNNNKAQNDSSTVGFKQLEFSFALELRSASLRQFNERTSEVENGLDGPQRGRFAQQSSAIAARFEVSIRLSAASLNGFASAAENAKDDENALDRLLKLTASLQDLADEFFNDSLSLINDFFHGDTSAPDFATSLNQLLDNLFTGFFGRDTGSNPTFGNTPAKGATASIQQLEFSFSFSAVSVDVTSTDAVQQGDPLVIDLDRDGIELTSYRQGAQFDLLGQGRAVNTAFVTGGDAFLALDRNGNGAIDDGTELFGEQHGASNGFEELRKFDSNGDNVIDSRDKVFESLRLFRDNGNGRTEPGELLSLREAGITSISLDYRDVRLGAAGGNTISQLATYQRADGSHGTAADALLNYTA